MVIFQFANKLPEADRSMESDGIREFFPKQPLRRWPQRNAPFEDTYLGTFPYMYVYTKHLG